MCIQDVGNRDNNQMNLQFSGNRALIVGGSCDLAIVLAKHLIKAGLFPVLTFRTQKGLDHLSERLRDFRAKYSTVYLDFSDPGSLDPALRHLDRDIDFMVDFAQGDFESLVASADEVDIYRFFAENISFRAEMIKRVARIMLVEKKGRLIYVSSSAAVKPNPGQGFYAAAKVASEALYRNLGIELGGRGITTVTLRPGYMDEGRGRAFLDSPGEGALAKVPIKRALSSEELAETILFYLSDSARGFNATEISIDGGLTAGK